MTEFVNVSGIHVRDLARGVMALLEQPFEEGMQADIAAGALVCLAVDLLRANYGDDHVLEGITGTVEQRLSRPLAFWGVAKAG